MAPPDAHVQLHIGIVALSEGCCFLLLWYEQIYDFVREASLAPDHERSLPDEDTDVQGCQLQIVPSHAWAVPIQIHRINSRIHRRHWGFAASDLTCRHGANLESMAMAGGLPLPNRGAATVQAFGARTKSNRYIS